MNDDRAPRALK